MRITIARLGAPADARGNVIAPAAIPPAPGGVPLLAEFDHMAPIGRAVVQPDGSADLELAPGIELDVDRVEADGTIGIGYRVLEAHEAAGGVRVIDRLEVLAVGVSRALIRDVGAFVPCSWHCDACIEVDKGTARPWRRPGESAAAAAARFTRETRGRCVEGCAFVAVVDEGANRGA